MKTFSTAALLLVLSTAQTHGCPFSKNSPDGAEAPCDANHSHLRRRTRLASLTEDEDTRAGIAKVIQDQKKKHDARRGLITTTCFSQTEFDDIQDNIDGIASVITDAGDRGHFFGGIVRLAAHDFMDFDINDSSSPLGPDGCLDFGNPANAGLDSIWCDEGCPLKALYDSSYASFVSRADFWVASAIAVIRLTSEGDGPTLPFRWGRTDNDVCPDSSARLPADTGCAQVEGTFIDRMGLSWTDATALLGAHTLGRGHSEFSGHPGTWVQNDDESTIFDKRFYIELLNRGWFPRAPNNDGVLSDWAWGGQNRGVMMLHTDICLAFDIPDGNDQNCCTNTAIGCNDGTTLQCETSEAVRPEAFQAVQAMSAGGGNNNDVFYEMFAESWQKATEIGQDSLNELADSCDVAGPPSTNSPVASPPPPSTNSPVASPPPPSTNSPVASPPDCADVESFVIKKKDGTKKKVDCEWVVSKDKCSKFSDKCPVSCDSC